MEGLIFGTLRYMAYIREYSSRRGVTQYRSHNASVSDDFSMEDT